MQYYCQSSKNVNPIIATDCYLTNIWFNHHKTYWYKIITRAIRPTVNNTVELFSCNSSINRSQIFGNDATN